MSKDNINKYVNKKAALFLFLSVFLLIMSVNTVNTFVQRTGGFVKRIELVRRSDPQSSIRKNLYLQDYIKSMRSFGSINISFAAQRDVVIYRNGFWPYTARLVLTDDKYINFANFRMIRGAFFTENSFYAKENVVVISSKTAYEFFYSYDVIGEEIELLGKNYTIAGVYEKNATLAGVLGESGVDRIYVPFQSVDGYENIPIQMLFIHDPNIKETALGDFKMRNDLVRYMNIDLDAFHFNNYYSCITDLLAYTRLFIFMLGLLSVFILLRFLSEFIKRCFAAIKKSYSDYYFFSLLYREKFHIIKTVAVAAFIIAGVILLLMAVRFKLNIRPEHIPPDNLLDVGFYLNKIRESIHYLNSPYRPEPTPFSTEFEYTKKLSGIFLICSVVTFFIYLIFMKILKKTGAPFKCHVKGILIAFPAALALSCVFSLISRMHIQMPFKELGIMAVFLLLSAAGGQETEKRLLTMLSSHGIPCFGYHSDKIRTRA